jgi:hypothetical protein
MIPLSNHVYNKPSIDNHDMGLSGLKSCNEPKKKKNPSINYLAYWSVWLKPDTQQTPRAVHPQVSGKSILNLEMEVLNIHEDYLRLKQLREKLRQNHDIRTWLYSVIQYLTCSSMHRMNYCTNIIWRRMTRC